MAYQKQVWENLPSTNTPVSAERLNYMEDGIYEASIGTSIEVHNDYNTSTTEPYSCNYVNGLNNYSTTEQVVGTWTDGRPIYRVTVETTTPSTTGNWKEIYTGHNVGFIIKYGGSYLPTENLKFAIPLSANDRNFWFAVNSSNNIQMAVDSSSDVGKNITVWFEYIKNN